MVEERIIQDEEKLKKILDRIIVRM